MKLFFIVITFGLFLTVLFFSGAFDKPETQKKTPQTSTATSDGKSVFLKYCMACHQADGSGVPGMYPPLAKSDWAQGDKKRLIHVVLHGLEGEISVNGETYAQVMPKQDFLTDKQIAQVLTYVRQNLGNKGDSIRVKEVTTERKLKK